MAWTWPLAIHLHDAIPGAPGDNFSFVWNLWWMRHVLATPGLAYFHTAYLFYPFGTPIADHPHTALPALVAATMLKPLTIVAAQNVLLLAYVFANMAVMYALAWDLTRHVRAAVLAAILFGLSPYVAVHLLGHFDLVAAWVLPAFALALRRAVRDGSTLAAAAAGALLASTAYIAYYYVVYEGLFAAVYLAVSVGGLTVARAARPLPQARRVTRTTAAIGAVLSGTAALVIASTGGGSFHAGRLQLSATTPQNALTVMWTCAIVWFACGWRASWRLDQDGRARRRRAVDAGWRIVAVFAAGAAPLFWEAAQLIARGEYVTQRYGWRSVPRGVDLLAPLLGHPRHPLMGSASALAYAALGQDRVEAIGWIGIVTIVLLVVGRAGRRPGDAGGVNVHDIRVWRAIAIAFAVFALGPFLTVGGIDTGLKLPEILLRYVPFASNARMPGRAMVVVYMAAAMLIAMSVSRAGGRLGSPGLQWLLIASIAFEYWDAPIPLTPLDRPPVYAALAAAPAGAVCEVPFGIGDGLSVGAGSQDRRVLYYATLHEHPLAGGYIGRMPADAADRYARLPVTAPLLQLSDGAASAYLPAGESPCRYLVVHRLTSSAALRAYVASLTPERIASDGERDLYRLP